MPKKSKKVGCGNVLKKSNDDQYTVHRINIKPKPERSAKLSVTGLRKRQAAILNEIRSIMRTIKTKQNGQMYKAQEHRLFDLRAEFNEIQSHLNLMDFQFA
jgi:hypothetical protein